MQGTVFASRTRRHFLGTPYYVGRHRKTGIYEVLGLFLPVYSI